MCNPSEPRLAEGRNATPDRTVLASDGDPSDRVDDLREGLLRLRRLMAEWGIAIRLPTPNPNWEPPEPLPIPADVVSQIVVQQRRSRGF